MIIEKIIGSIADFQHEGLETDKVLLDHHDMERSHQKMISEGGEKLAVSLDHGEKLFRGAVLYKDEKKMIVVDMIPEDALEIRPILQSPNPNGDNKGAMNPATIAKIL